VIILLSRKELAMELKRNPSYVSAMKRNGFVMPGGRATLEEARAWLTKHPEPRGQNKKAASNRRRP
jgi:hypothetical protein